MYKNIEEDDTIVIWDSKSSSLPSHNQIILWDSYEYNENDGIFSISELVEKNSENLRSEYLKIIFELGNQTIADKSVVDHLEIKSNFSYWWMTLLNEKCNFSKSPQITNSIKLLALKEWVKKSKYKKIFLYTANVKLESAIRRFCDEREIKYEHKLLKKDNKRTGFFKNFYRKMPYFLRALFWLINHLVSRWPLKGVGLSNWKSSEAKVTFISYLFNLNFESKAKGFYDSGYWANLPENLKEKKIKTNWLHIYIEDSVLPNAREAKKTINKFNRMHSDNQNHLTLHSFLSFKLIFNVLRVWLFLIVQQKKLKSSFILKTGFMWPLIEDDYLDSFIGPSAINNLLIFHLFDKAIGSLPNQEKGIYLQENQPWEYCLIYFWRYFKHSNNLIGVTSFPPRFWDLRFYYDSRCYSSNKSCKMPMSNFHGVNGENAKKLALDSGYPKKNILELEALRYLHLNDCNKESSIANSDRIGILVLGDYQQENTFHQMSLLGGAYKDFIKDFMVVVKAHPACKISKQDYPEFDFQLTNEPINKLLNDFSIVYASSNTSASIDAFYSGKLVLTVLDSSSLNFSPLRGIEGAIFVETQAQLVNIINNLNIKQNSKFENNNYFYLDHDLPRWNDLLLNPAKIE